MKKNRNNAVREPEGRTPANRSARRAALGGLFTALALIFSWLEWLFPFPIPIPGIILIAACVILLSFCFAVFEARKIKKIEAYNMLVAE